MFVFVFVNESHMFVAYGYFPVFYPIT